MVDIVGWHPGRAHLGDTGTQQHDQQLKMSASRILDSRSRGRNLCIKAHSRTAAQPHSRTAAQPHSRTAAQPKESMSTESAEKKLSLPEVTAIGIGGMIGGGIFAVLGLAIAVSGHAVALTLAGGGVIALITGISYSRLALTYREAGGSFTYYR
jgi:amino acid permease